MKIDHQMALNEFQGLPVGWDLYGGKPTTKSAGKSLRTLLEDETVIPRPPDRIFPHPLGGVMATWERDGVQLLAHLHPDGEFAAMGEVSGKKHMWLGKVGLPEFISFVRHCVWPLRNPVP